MRRTITRSGETPLGPIVPPSRPLPGSFSIPATGGPWVEVRKQEDQSSPRRQTPNEREPRMPRPPQSSRMLFRLSALLSL